MSRVLEGAYQKDMQWEPIKETENTVLTFEVLKPYLEGPVKDTIKIFKDNLQDI